ncbi:hypothetical protein EB001_02490 [bacterium]|nr:hypothetical protein [bacterium]
MYSNNAIICIPAIIMALFFNLKTLEQQSNGDSSSFIAMLEYHYSKRLPYKHSKHKPSKVSLAGNCFILNPEPLFADKSTDILFKIQYIKLAARRDYNLYRQYNYRALQKSYYPDIDYNSIKYNPLLKITNTEILFKYEEN